MVIFYDIQTAYHMVTATGVHVETVFYVLNLRETIRNTHAHIRVFVAMGMFAQKKGGFLVEYPKV